MKIQLTETNRTDADRMALVAALARHAPPDKAREVAILFLFCISKAKAIRRVSPKPDDPFVHPRWKKHRETVEAHLMGNLGTIAALVGAENFRVEELPWHHYKLICGPYSVVI